MMATPNSGDDEFYIGYDDRMPVRTARHVTAAVCAITIAALGIATIVTVAFASLPPSRFEYGVITATMGILRHRPYPTLERGGRRLWLVGKGKFGAERVLASLQEGPAVVTGSRVVRGGHEMLEVHSAGRIPATTLRGEIVDSKCFLGVMNPAEGAVHRDCAVQCLRGGITPMIRVRGRDGREQLVVPLAANGGPIGRDLASLSGRAIEVTGQLVLDGSEYVLYADLPSYRVIR